MRALTEEQERAVGRRSQSLALSAGAGSGKTSVLVERFVRAVHEDGVSPARILAMTFTERAAAELRARVRERFATLGDRRSAQETETAYVSTVHGFCSRLLRGHALALGLDPDFVVLDDPRAEGLRVTALARALSELVSGPHAPQAVDLVAAWGVDRLGSCIAGLHEELRSRGQRRPRLPPASAPDRRLGAAAAAALGRAADQAACELDDPQAQPAGARARSALLALERASELLRTPAARWDAQPPLGSRLAALRLPSANGALAGPACETYRHALDAYAGLCADDHGARALGLVDELLCAFARTYETLKRERGAVDFDDLELLARELLLEDAGVREAWSERFDLIMVDEYQDTNPRQLDVLRALERENLFTVGDEFQSIYGFRHADSRLFGARRAELALSGASLSLRLNFRGRPALLEVVNAVFLPRFGEDFEPLQAGREDPLAHDDAPLVELLVTDTPGWEAQPWVSEGLPPARPWRHAEARLLAQRVAELVADGEVSTGQVAVLVRASTDIPVYERALEEQGLPTLAAGASGYWSGQQVEDLLACLRLLANPLDELALFGTLACPIVGVSSDALAVIAACGRLGGGPWRVVTDAFCPRAVAGPPTSAAGEDLSARLAPEDRRALARFCPWLECERAQLRRHSVAEVVLRILRHSGYDEHVLGLRWGERRLANVHKLLRLAREFEASRGRDLRAFLDMAAGGGKGRAREPDAPIADADVQAVRLMTIHAAKGLEWDVVAVADLGRRSRVEVPDVLVDAERVGLRLPAMDGSEPARTLQFEALRAERQEREAAEEARVLYVAMTRARERLLLSGAADLECWPRPGAPAAPPLSWLGPALGLELPTGPDVADGDQVRPAHAENARVRWRVSSATTVGEVLRRGTAATVTATDASAPIEPSGTSEPPPRMAAELTRTEAPADSERAAERRGGGIGTLSYTAIAQHERCGYRYYLEHVLGLPPEEIAAPDGDRVLGGRFRGELVHRLLEQLDFRRSEEPAPALIAKVGRELGHKLNELQVAEIAALTAAVARTELGGRVAAAPRVYREHHFAFSLGPDLPLLTGVVDVMAHELGGTVLIVDYKSDRVADAELRGLVERVYLVQRHIYALAALQAGALRVDVIHWFLERPDEPVGASFEPADAGALAAELATRMHTLVDGRFEVTERPHRELCLSCPGRRALCSWDETRTLARSAGQAPAAVL